MPMNTHKKQTTVKKKHSRRHPKSPQDEPSTRLNKLEMENEELRTLNDRLQTFARALPIATAILDRNMHYVAVSDRWLETFKLAGQVLTGRSHYDVFPETSDDWKALHNRCMAGGREIREAERVDPRDGSIRSLRWEVVPWPGEENETGGIIISVEDITERKKSEDALKRSEARFRKLFEFAPDGIVIVNERHQIIMVSDRTRQLTGYSRGELVRQPIEKLVPEEVSAMHVGWRNDYEQGLRPNAHKRGESSELFCRRKDGSTFPADISVSPLAGDEGPVVFAIIRDITGRKKAESSQRLAAAVFENTTEGIVVTDVEGRIESINKAFTRITGYDASEAVGDKLPILKSDLQDASFQEAVWETVRKSGIWKGRFLNRRKNGEIYPQETTINEIRNGRGVVAQYCGIFRDVSEQTRLEEALRSLSRTDELTGLANRRSFGETVELEWRRALRAGSVMAIIMVDIDDFKEYNDMYGHPEGDECLKKVGRELKKAAHRAGDLAARYGGDEFILLLTMTNADEARLVAEETRERVKMMRIKHELNDTGFVTLSMGIAAAVPSRDASAEELIASADRALYRAKQAGKNRVKSEEP